MVEHKRKLKCELYNDSMQNFRCYPMHKAQLMIADVPYGVGNNFYGSSPIWYRVIKVSRTNLESVRTAEKGV